MKTCNQCQSLFEIFDEDRRFFELFDVAEPRFCFPCRLQRKMTFYNRRNLYKRTDALTGKSIVSIYSPDKDLEAYNTRDWYSDKWDPMDYGQDFDPNRSFFEQFEDLMKRVPKNALAIIGDNVNSDYTSDNYKLKDCYLIFDGEQAEGCYFGETFVGLKSCMDFLFLQFSELCYECIGCSNCYNLKFSRFCKNSSNSWFLKDCIGVKNSFGCSNLRNKEYCIFNEQKTKEEYEAFMANFHSGHFGELQKMREKVEVFYATQPSKSVRNVNCEDSVGDNLQNCKNAYMCFDCNDQRDCRYMTDCLLDAKDSMDIHVWGDGMEQCYNSLLIGGDSIRKSMCSFYCGLGSSDLYYSFWCNRNCENLLGCVALKHKKFCILNKQYSEGEYNDLFSKIKAKMQSEELWGEFFPPEMSFFGYNETQAMDYFPLTKEEVLAKGWKWSDYESEIKAERSIPAGRLPDDIADVPDDILNWAIECEVTGKPFKLVAQELQFYRQNNLPIPRRHPDQRHWDRLALKEPYTLFDRECGKCSSSIQTTYSPDRPEKVYCEKCYQEMVY